jgi:dihydroorotate dehydrogenase electron transfer subunit
MKRAQALIIDHQQLKGPYRLLTLKVPEIAVFAKPGQFVHVRCGQTLEPLLRRPISIHKIEADRGELMLLYQVVGRGTQLLAEKQPGEQVDIMGPLGRGFTLPEWVNRAVVVGGGIGAAPLLSLVETLVIAKVETTVILGARSGELLIGVEPMADLGVQVIMVTEDGSVGQPGLVTAALKQLLHKGSIGENSKLDYLYSCGPKPMLKAVTALALEYNLPGEVSLEERMGCGVGACLACVCKVRKQEQMEPATGLLKESELGPESGAGASSCSVNEPVASDFSYKRVCDHGPVFSLGEVVWDD